MYLRVARKLTEINTNEVQTFGDLFEWDIVTKSKKMSFYTLHGESFGSKFLKYILRRQSIEDGNILEKDLININELSDDVKTSYGNRIPVEATHPESLEDFLLEKSGSFFLRRGNDNEYVVDFSRYEQYEVRDGFERYGGVVTIKDGKIKNIKYMGKIYYTVSKNYARIESIFKATLFIVMVLEIHAIRIHVLTSQDFAVWARDRFRQEVSCLNDVKKMNPIAKILLLFTLGTLSTHSRITSLLEPNALGHKISALTEKSFIKLGRDSILKGYFLKEEILGIDGTVWNRQITPYWHSVNKMMKKFFTKDIYKEERERYNINSLTNFAVVVTALHNQFGDSQLHSMSMSGFFPPKIYKKNFEKISKNDCIILQTLLVGIGASIPQIGDNMFRTYFSENNGYYQKYWNIFIDEVISQSDFDWFSPKNFEVSAGI